MEATPTRPERVSRRQRIKPDQPERAVVGVAGPRFRTLACKCTLCREQASTQKEHFDFSLKWDCRSRGIELGVGPPPLVAAFYLYIYLIYVVFWGREGIISNMTMVRCDARVCVSPPALGCAALCRFWEMGECSGDNAEDTFGIWQW